MFLIRFWSNLTKKDSVENAKYEIKKISTFTHIFRTFFHGSGSGFFRIGSGFSADPDLDARKKVLYGSGSETKDSRDN